MSSITKIRQQIEEEHIFAEQCANAIKISRIIIRADDTSYIDKVGVYVMTIIRELGKGVSYEDLIEIYPSLTKEDINACLLFISARAKRKI